MNYIHKKNIAHRDLKVDNIVVAFSKPIDFTNIEIKLIDFGFAKQYVSGGVDEFIGTPYYIAPEIIKNQKHDTKVDIWSLGVLTYYLISGKLPFQSDDRNELFQMIT